VHVVAWPVSVHLLTNKESVQQNPHPVERVVGLDVHPDSFTAALVRGPTPLAATVEKLFNKVPIDHLVRWAQKNTTASDALVLEASGNSFHVARGLREIGRRVEVLESCQLGKLKEAHANNDKISATRIAKAYLSGTAKTVWVPDARCQERRDWFHAYAKAAAGVTRASNSLGSFLSDNGVRLEQRLIDCPPARRVELIRAARVWSPSQWQVIEIKLADLEHAQSTETRWSSLMAQEVVADPQLLGLVRLCGIRDVVAFAVGAFVGDVRRFAEPKKLVKYVGLNPAFDDSGEGKWSGGIGGHGHKQLRGLLVEAAHSILRSRTHPIAEWGRRLLARKGDLRLVVAAMARKLLVAIWYQLMGRSEPLEEISAPLSLKIGKIISKVGEPGLRHLHTTRSQLRERIEQSLLGGRSYTLDRTRMYQPARTRPAIPSVGSAPAPAT
jgi:transposase